MGFTFHSLVLAVVWSDLIILLFHLLRKRYTLSESKEAAALLTVYLLCLVRLFIPIDFWFSKTISVAGIYALAADYLTLRHFLFSFSLWELFLLIWCIGGIISLLRFFVHYKSYIQKINLLELYSPEQINRVMPTVFQHLGKTVPCTVCKCPDTQIPAGIGIFHRSILLPADPLSDEELFYILVHETAHFINRDLLFKYIVQICICIFWWNPLLYVLQKNLCQLLEIRCDASVIKHLHAEETLSYMNTIVNTLKRENENHISHKFPPPPSRFPVFLLDASSDQSVQERFCVLCTEYKIRHTTPAILAASVVAFALFLWSYTFLPLPSYDPPIEEIEEDGAINVDPENSIIIYEDGSYYIVTDASRIYIPNFVADSMLQTGFTLQNGEQL